MYMCGWVWSDTQSWFLSVQCVYMNCDIHFCVHVCMSKCVHCVQPWMRMLRSRMIIMHKQRPRYASIQLLASKFNILTVCLLNVLTCTLKAHTCAHSACAQLTELFNICMHMHWPEFLCVMKMHNSACIHVFECECVCVCVYVYIYIYIYIYIHKWITLHAHIYTYIHTHTQPHMYTFIHICLCSNELTECIFL